MESDNIIIALLILIIGAIFSFGIPILSKISTVSGILQGKERKETSEEIKEEIKKALKESVEKNKRR